MLNEIKLVLLRPLNNEMDKYSAYKSMLSDLENTLMFDDSDKVYKNDMNNLNKTFKVNKNKQEYEENKRKIMIDYKKKLDTFAFNKERYELLKQRLANYNIYEVKKRMEESNAAQSLKDLRVPMDEIEKLCNENGIIFVPEESQ